ncbi:MAG: arginine--tRNA ligase [Patescibacteria group bacterium]|nr:arginine--tRNA ligase [Patescibacteria group bacterium]
MEKLKKNLEKNISALLGLAADFEFRWSAPPNPAWGDLALPVFELAKASGEETAAIFKKIQSLKLPAGVERFEIKVSYINFFINANFLAHNIELVDKKFGMSKSGRGRRIMLEFSQPNTHKEFHIGHARNAILGQSIVNILRAAGFKVIPANYIGDTGAHVAKWIWAYTKFHSGETPGRDRAKFLSKIYQEASSRAEESEENKKQIAEILQRLESGDPKLARIWKRTRAWSLAEFKNIYKILGIDFDVCFFESEEEEPGKKIVADLLRRGIAERSQGAVIVNLEKYNLGAFLIIRSDGTALYATKDLALAQKKFNKYKIDESWYVVDARQLLYFKQLFKTLEIMGIKSVMRHLAYAFVATPEGVISSRRGEVPSFTDLYALLCAMAEKSTAERHKKWSKKKISNAARAIALAAIKFEMLKTSREKEIVIDPASALAFEGFTGPYLLYSVARINSIFAKSGKSKKIPWNKLKIALLEKELLLKVMDFPRVIDEAARSAEPAHLVQYLFDLSQKFAEFYHQINILKAAEPERSWRLALSGAVKRVMENGLEILNIETLDQM